MNTNEIEVVVPFHRAAVGEEEIKAVAEVIRSGWMTMGPKTFEFEKEFAKYRRRAGCHRGFNRNRSFAPGARSGRSYLR